MRYPAVGAWAVSTLRALDPDGRAPGAVPARLTAVAAAAAVRSGLDAEVPVLPVAGVVSLPSLGAARVDGRFRRSAQPPRRAEVRWARGRVEIPAGGHPDAPGWLGIRGCRAGDLEAVIEDLDPFRMPAVDRPRAAANRSGGAGLAASSAAGLAGPRGGAPCGRRRGRRRDLGDRSAEQVGLRPPQLQFSRRLRRGGDV